MKFKIAGKYSLIQEHCFPWFWRATKIEICNCLRTELYIHSDWFNTGFIFNLCKIVEGCTDISSNGTPLVCVSPCCVYWRTSGSAIHEQCAEERMTGSAACDAEGPLKALFRGEFKDVPTRDKVEMGAVPSFSGACPIRGAPVLYLLPYARMPSSHCGKKSFLPVLGWIEWPSEGFWHLSVQAPFPKSGAPFVLTQGAGWALGSPAPSPKCVPLAWSRTLVLQS